MDPPTTPTKTLARSLKGAFPVKYPVLEEADETNEGISGNFDSAFDAEVKLNNMNESESLGQLAEARSPTNTRKKRMRKSKKDLRLANRTTEILSNYQNFLREQEMEISINYESPDPPEDGFRQLHYHEHKAKNRTSSNHGGDKASRLLREFSTPDIELCSRNNGHEKRKHSTPSIILSPKVKYGILLGFGLPLFAVIVIVATAGGSHQMKIPTRENDSGSRDERTYVLEHESGDMIGKPPNYNAIVPRKNTQPKPAIRSGVLKESLEKETKIKAAMAETDAKSESASTKVGQEPKAKSVRIEEPENEAEIKSAPPDDDTRISNAIATFDLEKILHSKFKPLWLSSREGWNGGSHDDATKFCQNIRGKELCPFSTMCPHGPGRNVLAGRRPVDFSSQGEQYAPVYGNANRWIMVGRKNGDASTTCTSHEQLEMRPPSWGLSGDRAEMKLHIMCCSVPKG